MKKSSLIIRLIMAAMIACILSLHSLAASQPKPATDARKAFQQMEEKLTQAKTVQCSLDLQSTWASKKLSFQGKLLIGDQDRFRLQLKGKLESEDDTKEIITFSDGDVVVHRIGDRQATFSQSPKNVGRNWKFNLARIGVSLPMMGMNDANPVDTTKLLVVSDFSMGKAEVVGGTMATVVHYRLKSGKEASPLKATVWIDPKTHLPLKRTIGLEGKEAPFFSSTEMYSAWSLDEKIDAGAFDAASETQSATLSPDGAYFAESTGYGTSVYEVKTGKLVKKLDHRTGASHLKFSPNSKYLAFDQLDVLALWDWRNGKQLGSWKGTNRFSFEIAFSADSTILAAADDNSLRVWNTATQKQLLTAALPHEMDSVACSPDGKWVAVGGSGGKENGKRFNEIKVWTVPGGKLHCVLKGSDASLVRSLAFSPDGKRLASGLGNSSVRLWDLDSKKELWNQKLESTGYDILNFSPDGKQLAAGGFQWVTLLDAANGSIIKTYNVPGSAITSLSAFAKQGHLLVARWDRVLSIELASGKQKVLFSK